MYRNRHLRLADQRIRFGRPRRPMPSQCSRPFDADLCKALWLRVMFGDKDRRHPLLRWRRRPSSVQTCKHAYKQWSRSAHASGRIVVTTTTLRFPSFWWWRWGVLIPGDHRLRTSVHTNRIQQLLTSCRRVPTDVVVSCSRFRRVAVFPTSTASLSHAASS